MKLAIIKYHARSLIRLSMQNTAEEREKKGRSFVIKRMEPQKVAGDVWFPIGWAIGWARGVFGLSCMRYSIEAAVITRYQIVWR